MSCTRRARPSARHAGCSEHEHDHEHGRRGTCSCTCSSFSLFSCFRLFAVLLALAAPGVAAAE
ncbi:MAG: hypothetical protein ACREQ9_23960, partial [Candidatus Binatia bacterium]